MTNLQSAALSPGGADSIRRYITSVELSGSQSEDDKDRNDVLASISIGNLDAAKAGTFLVPGMNNDVGGSMKDLTDSAENFYDMQGTINFNNGGDEQEQAVVARIGYETPPLVPVSGVLGLKMAQVGGERLAAAADGFNTTRSGEADLHLVSHSYGTTATGEALTTMETRADSVTSLASAGITNEAVVHSYVDKDGLAVESNSSGDPEIYYAKADGDYLAVIGLRLGGRNYPEMIDGAKGFSAEGGYDSKGTRYGRVTGHDLYMPDDALNRGYLSTSSSSLYYTGLVSTGRGESMGQLAPLPQMEEWEQGIWNDLDKEGNREKIRKHLSYSEEKWDQLSDGTSR